MDEPILVEADLSVAPPRPRSFHWQGQRHPVSDVGRRWIDDEGRQHYLVMTPGDEVYELVYAPSDASWRLLRTPSHFGGPGRRI